jgi:glycerate dehydrogenase
MKVLALTSKAQEVLPEGITKAKDIDDLLANSDVISLHCPLTPDTEHIINKVNIAKMKRNAIIINTGRGPLVDENAVAEALTEGRIEAFCADVLTQEPPRNGSPLTTAPRCFITPHIAWASGAARQRLVATLIDNIRAFADGTPKNVVN